MARSEPCAICGGSSGLFGYATEDGYICKKCLERAGLKKAAFSNPAAGYSSSQLRRMIHERDARLNAGPMAVRPEDLRAAEQMSAYCRDFGTGYQFLQLGGPHNFKVLAENLYPDEKVYTVFYGIREYETDPKPAPRRNRDHETERKNDGYIYAAVTSRRIIWTRGMESQVMIKSVNIQNVNDITKRTQYSEGYIEIDTLKECIRVKTFPALVDNIYPLVQYALDRARQDAKAEAAPAPAPTPAAPSLTDELLKYKQLLDAGAITEAEYAALKAKLLGI